MARLTDATQFITALRSVDVPIAGDASLAPVEALQQLWR